HGELLAPPAMILVDAAVLSFAVSVFVAGVALSVCRHTNSPRMARLALKLIIVSAVLILLYGCKKLEIDGRLLPTTDRITRLTSMLAAFLLVNGAALLALGSSGRPRPHPKTQAGSE